MPTETLFQQRLSPTKIFGFDGGSGFMVIDAAVEDSHDAEVIVTEHPIEFGANVSDHIIIQPRVYSLKGRISTVSTRSILQGIINLATGSDILEGSNNRPQLAWEKLQGLMFERVLITVESNLKVYDNVVIESLSSKQDAQTARVLDFDAVFREVFVVDAPRTDITPVVSPQPSLEPPAPSLSASEQADIEENAGELALVDQEFWATDEQFFSQTNIPDLRNIGP